MSSLFVGPSQLPRDDTWMAGPVLGASQPPTDQSLGLKCQWPEMAAVAARWMERCLVEEEAPMLYPLACQTTMCPMQPAACESSQCLKG